MNPFDIAILHFLNQFAQQSEVFDNLMFVLANSKLLKGGVLMMLVWWAWHAPPPAGTDVRRHLIMTLSGSFVAMTIARVLALTLPFRLRPMLDATLEFRLPLGMDITNWDTLNSFPSDHAALFFSIAVGFYFISRRIFLFAFLYVLIFIAVPRVYLGLHYPTDIFAGALIGGAAAVICNSWRISEQWANLVLRFGDLNPRFFYPALFIVTYQISDLFDAVRIIAGHLYKTLFGA